MSVVNKGDTLVIPHPSEEHKTVKIEWSQSLRSRSENYVVLVAKNERAGNEVPVFFAAEWYNEGKLNELFTKAADGKSYKLVVDSKSQYGQKNSSGENRFIVYHDQSRKIYQHRFVEQTLALQLGNLGSKIAGLFGYGQDAGTALKYLKNIVGDYLHTF